MLTMVDKSELDTLQLYLGSLVSKEKAQSLLSQFEKAGEDKAYAAIKLFETRSHVQLKDVERILGE